MGLPWLRILDTLIGVTNIARGSAARPATEESERLAPGAGALGHLETRLAGVVIAALKEAFDRDSRRLELEREQMEAERQRVERALRLELLRQAGEREIARLRLLAAVAAATWLGTLFFSARLIGGSIASRVTLGIGWGLLLAALAASFAAQGSLGASLGRIGESPERAEPIGSSMASALAPWLIVIGLAAVGVSVLVAP
jgi:hypothetical protein